MLNFDVTEFAPQIINRCNQLQSDLIGNERFRFIPCDGKPRALAIAHVDTVFDDKPAIDPPKQKTRLIPGKRPAYTGYNRLHKPVQTDPYIIKSGALDDRLGVAILLDILPVVMPDFKYDILLTTDEEIGQSTASDWCSSLDIEDLNRAENYQFIFEFDRAGTDVVTYQFNNPVAESYLEEAGWHIGLGAFTDICDVMPLGIWAANFGCGYHNQHSNDCYVDLYDLDINLRRFALFVHKIGSDMFEDVKRPTKSHYQGTYSYSNYSQYFDRYNDSDNYYKSTPTIVDKDDEPSEYESDPFYANETYLGEWGNFVEEDDYRDSTDHDDIYIGADGRVTDANGHTVELEDDDDEPFLRIRKN